jgi:hypothetical protein
MKKLCAVFVLAAAAGAAPQLNLAVLAGAVAADYTGDPFNYQNITGYNPQEENAPAAPARATDLALAPAALTARAYNWRASLTALWHRHRVAPGVDPRQVNCGTLDANGGYIWTIGAAATKRVKPYGGAFFRGGFIKAENVHNGVLTYGFGPELGAVLDFALRGSYLLVTLGYEYQRHSLTGTKVDDARGDDPPGPPYYNYTYIPAATFPRDGSSYFVHMRSSLQLTRRWGVEVEVRYDANVTDSLANGLTAALGPSAWL